MKAGDILNRDSLSGGGKAPTDTVPKDAAFRSPHGSDNPLIFGNFRGGAADRFYVYLPAVETEQLGTLMHRAWSAFAHNGSPGWDTFAPDKLQAMVFDTESAQQCCPHERTLQAYWQHLSEAPDLI